MRLTRLAIAAAMILIASDALAQNPPAGPPAGRGGGRGGRGGGRGAVRSMTLTSTAFKDGETLPDKYAQPGEEVSPPLAWTGAPDSTKSFVLIVHDLDAVNATGMEDVLHWMVWNIPPTMTSLPEHVPQGGELGDGRRQISVTGPYYRGPGAPATGPMHHYAFEIFALDTTVDVPAVGAAPAATRSAVAAAMAGHVRGKGVLVTLWRRRP
jgi:Raf kinase inhibitor-like YbhB/YbcL family protein